MHACFMLARVSTPSSLVRERERGRERESEKEGGERGKEGEREREKERVFIFKRNDGCLGTF